MEKQEVGQREHQNEPGQAWDGITDEAREGVQMEHQMSIFQVLRLYKKAIFWSLVVSMATLMEGYDNSLLGSLVGYESFRRQFGMPFEGGYQLTAAWQSALSLTSPVGFVLGLLLNGFIVEKFGYKRILLTTYCFTTAFIFIVFFAKTKAVLLVGELFCCITFGIYGGLAPGYAVEVGLLYNKFYLPIGGSDEITKLLDDVGQLHIHYRLYYLGSHLTIGHTIRAAILLGFSSNNTQWAYRIPFAIQWAWPIPLFTLTLFAPESPWWLVRQGRLEAAERSIQRLSADSLKFESKKTVAVMVHTDNHEREITQGTSYLDCFRKTDLRRTEIACLAWLTQQMQGVTGLGGSYFYEQLGISQTESYALSFGGEAISLLGDATAWCIVGSVGRRALYLWGVASLALIMFIVGFLDLAPDANTKIRWAQASLLLISSYAYDVTIGPLAFTVASETSSTRLRAKTVALARSTYYASGIITSVISPYMINPTAGNWKGKAGFLNGGVICICFVWVYFRLPECKDRTFEELDILFERKIPARQFRKYVVDLFDEDPEHLKAGEQVEKVA